MKREIIKINHQDWPETNWWHVGWYNERNAWVAEIATRNYEIACLVKRELDAKRPLSLPENQTPLQP
jgi:hypothetical protein